MPEGALLSGFMQRAREGDALLGFRQGSRCTGASWRHWHAHARRL